MIPAFNAAKYIRETLDSVLAQTYRPIEVIVVDDGSTDGTREQILAYGDRVRYVWQPNRGPSSPRNHGVRLASGEFVAFLDADDLIAPQWIAAAVAVMKRRPDVGLTFMNFVHFDSAGVDPTDHFATCSLLGAHLAGRRNPGDPVVLPPAVSTDILLVENFGSSAPVVRRAAIAAAAGFDETIPANEDYDFNYRIAARYHIAVIPDVLMHKRRHDGNLTAHPDLIFSGQIMVRYKMLAATSDARVRRSLWNTIGTYHLGLAYYYTGRDNRRAFRHACRGLWFRRRPSVRHFARIVADVAGRDTNGQPYARAANLDAGSSS